jgi:hypothetical protein
MDVCRMKNDNGTVWETVGFRMDWRQKWGSGPNIPDFSLHSPTVHPKSVIFFAYYPTFSPLYAHSE